MKNKQASRSKADEHEEKFDVDKDVVVGMFEKLVDVTYMKAQLGTASESSDPLQRITSKLRCLEFSLTGAMNSLGWRLKNTPEDEDHNAFKGLRAEVYLLVQAAKWAAQIHEVIDSAQRRRPEKRKRPKNLKPGKK